MKLLTITTLTVNLYHRNQMHYKYKEMNDRGSGERGSGISVLPARDDDDDDDDDD